MRLLSRLFIGSPPVFPSSRDDLDATRAHLEAIAARAGLSHLTGRPVLPDDGDDTPQNPAGRIQPAKFAR